MTNINSRRLVLLCLLQWIFLFARAKDFILVSNLVRVSIYYDELAPAIDSITAHLLAEDIQRVSGYMPIVKPGITSATGNVIIIGNESSAIIRNLINSGSTLFNRLVGKWECYALNILDKPTKNISKALIIAGSDNRGTAYGVFDISERIGVSPWYWWADVHPTVHQDLSVKVDDFISSPPSVKYRGIFLNDEDWGLQPWAAKTFEPETGDIGPKTYAKIFELLLRLKANLVWPAMHPGTKAFYHYPGNKKVAADYCIIIGSSHAEPMLRNNVAEWNEKTMGPFNYLTNRDKVYNYWEQRLQESKGNDVIYSLGMRGVHDSGIEGVSSTQEAVPLVERIITEQREMLQKDLQKNITSIPQAFTAYKEVLDIYDNGLKLPEDITLVWPDDNYGYIQRLNNEEEKNRSGGSGVYYHASYWGRPHDYLWLSSTHPSLIREEMMKAYDNNTKKLWVMNVGDLKPLEYNIQLFLDMAYNAEPFKESGYVKNHLQNFVSKIFGSEHASDIRDVLWKYYQLAFERRPEFMGWSQTEPTTKTNYTDYNHFYYGDQAQQRIDEYEDLQKLATSLQKEIRTSDADAFYELVYYPVVCSAYMNKKFLFRDKSFFYAKQNRISAITYVAMAQQAYDSIFIETDYYNNRLANGKWKNMMSMKPRDLPVYQPPVPDQIDIDSSDRWNISPEGSSYSNLERKNFLPPFAYNNDQHFFVDVYSCLSGDITWTSSISASWIKVSEDAGTLTQKSHKSQERVWVSIDWNNIPINKKDTGIIVFKASGTERVVTVIADNTHYHELAGYKGFIERNGYLSMFAANYSREINAGHDAWEKIEGLAHNGNAMESSLDDQNSFNESPEFYKKSPCLQYDFYTTSASPAEASVITLPTFPLNKKHSVRCAVAIDDDVPKVLDFKTVGRTEEWKQNVLSNTAVRKYNLQLLQPGQHVLKIYMVDPGVILDRITLNLGGLQKGYGTIPETKLSLKETRR